MATYSSKKYPSGSVTSAQLADGTVVAVDLADGAVTSAKVADTAITPTKMANSGAELGMRNRIINGNFDIWQRGTSFSNPSGDTYTADRFLIVSGGSTTGDSVTQQTFTPGQTDVPGEPTYFFRYTAGATSSNKVLHHRVEDVRTFAGQTCTLSFYAKASTAHTSTVEFQQNFGSGGSTAVTQSPVAYTMSTAWQKFTFTLTLPSISGKTIGTSSYVYISFIRSLPASNISIDIAQMQFEAGSTATPFERRLYGHELSLCQRYYYSTGSGTAGGHQLTTCLDHIAYGVGDANGERFPVTMRTAPTVVLYGRTSVAGYVTRTDNGAQLSSTSSANSLSPVGFRRIVLGGGLAGGYPALAIEVSYTADAEL